MCVTPPCENTVHKLDAGWVGLWITPICVAAVRTSRIGLDQSSICPFQRCLLSTCRVPGPGLDTGVLVANNTAKATTLMKPTFY